MLVPLLQGNVKAFTRHHNVKHHMVTPDPLVFFRPRRLSGECLDLAWPPSSCTWWRRALFECPLAAEHPLFMWCQREILVIGCYAEAIMPSTLRQFQIATCCHIFRTSWPILLEPPSLVRLTWSRHTIRFLWFWRMFPRLPLSRLGESGISTKPKTRGFFLSSARPKRQCWYCCCSTSPRSSRIFDDWQAMKG